MDIGAIRKAVPAAVGDPNIPGLNHLGYVPDSVPEPCFYSGEVEIDFDQTFQRGVDKIQLRCRLLVGRGDDRGGQEQLDKYLAGSGPYSVKQRLVEARGAPGQLALGGLCDDLHLRRIQGYRFYQVGESTQYYGAEFVIVIIGEGT